MEHLTVDVGEVRLHGVAAGRGPMVVLLHGFPEFWYSWRHQVSALAERFRVVAVDMRGYNRSDALAGVEHYRADRVAADVAGLVSALGEERAAVVGHDWGGVIAWRVAARHPERVGRLAVLAGPHPAAMARRLRSSWRQRRKSWYILAFQVPFLPEALIRLAPRWFVEQAMRRRSAVPGAFSDEDLDRFAEPLSRPGRLEAMLAYYRAAFRGRSHGARRALAPVTCPTLILWGDRDFALETELARDSAAFVAGPVEVDVLPRTGHWIQQERPDEVNRRLLAFLEAGR